MFGLKFRNLTFNKGLNLTVRRGDELYSNMSHDWMFKILNEKGEEYARAKIMVLKLRRFNELTDEELEYEHDPNCRTVEGLLKAMKGYYPDFREDEEVTLIFFQVLEGS
jgi:hypothetical protein